MQFIRQEKRSLLANIRHYLKKEKAIEECLSKEPFDWRTYQEDFNSELDRLFKNILVFEKEQRAQGKNKKVEKLKEFFIKNFREHFKRGEYCTRSIEKPYGYAGDFRIIDSIYANDPDSSGLERLYDNYFLASEISRSVRARKEDFKILLKELISEKGKRPVNIMNLGCGPCREIYELLKGPF